MTDLGQSGGSTPDGGRTVHSLLMNVADLYQRDENSDWKGWLDEAEARRLRTFAIALAADMHALLIEDGDV